MEGITHRIGEDTFKCCTLRIAIRRPFHNLYHFF